MNISIKQLQAIETLAKVKSFRIASHQLCISQPALSKQIKNVEDMYGFDIFIRSPNGVMLSSQGEIMINEIISLNNHIAKVDSYIKEIAQDNMGSLQIGFGKSSYDFLPNIIRDFKAQYASTHLSLLDFASHEQEEKLLVGLLDIAFMREPKNSNLERLKVSSDEFVLVVSKHLYQSAQIDFYLDKYDLLMLTQKDKSEMNRHIKRILMGKNVRESYISDDIQTILTLITSHVGVSILPRKSILQHSNELVVIPFEQDTSWNIYMVWDALRISKSIENFVQYVKGFIN
ncbi:LysR family transcriptional regulator [Vibrio sp. S17_S38]|uniref:LysR family transcriptional regulator n=1 Tax=Vibrio sp. S17_S38 TaxID=2720229 RepID=UPI0016810AB4|nr:LysR family transcriptional regulator [Vibrio sp. S17_S38]MBD1573345.1 LysR family transcriptional regulator [Vibrio sp. S17_S38]